MLIGSSYALQSGAVSAVLGGTANLTKSTSGTVILSGNNTYAGSTAVNAGTLQVGDGVSGSIDANSAISVASGARLALNISGTFLNNAGIANSGTIEGMQGSGSPPSSTAPLAGRAALPRPARAPPSFPAKTPTRAPPS